jgi:signal transduction histidine kinase
MERNILLVEDDHALLAGMHDFLELSGYLVMTAENGLAALDELDACDSPPDLIVSDIMMPDMDGYEFLAAVRKREEWVGIPFIFLTAKSTRQDVRSGKQLGADDYVTKPFDVEDLLVAIDARLKRRDELEELNATRAVGLKRRILTTLNHEFRTPLSYVIAYSDMIINGQQELDPQELHDFLVAIHSGGERLMNLVEDFLMLVEMETGQAVQTYQLRRETILNLNQLVDEVVQSYQAQAEEVGLVLRFDRSPEELPPIQGDTTFLKAAVKHLVDNAIKFSKDTGSQVEVNLRDQNGQVILTVKDDGMGVDPKKHDHLFEMFYQDERKKLEQQGMGAGLTIVKHVATLHGGQVTMESEPGVGSTFALNLPASY